MSWHLFHFQLTSQKGIRPQTLCHPKRRAVLTRDGLSALCASAPAPANSFPGTFKYPPAGEICVWVNEDGKEGLCVCGTTHETEN